MEALELPDGFSQPGVIFEFVNTMMQNPDVQPETQLAAAKILFEEIRFYSQSKVYQEEISKLSTLLFDE